MTSEAPGPRDHLLTRLLERRLGGLDPELRSEEPLDPAEARAPGASRDEASSAGARCGPDRRGAVATGQRASDRNIRIPNPRADPRALGPPPPPPATNDNLIGAPRFELGTSPTRTVRATRLRHAPMHPAVSHTARGARTLDARRLRPRGRRRRGRPHEPESGAGGVQGIVAVWPRRSQRSSPRPTGC
jgi:hypothetical protein